MALFGIRDALTAWEVGTVPTGGIAAAGLIYLRAVSVLRSRGAGETLPPRSKRWPRRYLVAFMTGLLVLVIAVDGPPDVLAERSFSLHMVQHLLIQLVAAPLLLLGAPVGLLLRADLRWLPRRALAAVLRSPAAAVFSHPVVTFALFAVVLVGSHLTPLYDVALEREWVHGTEHLAYLLTALLFWWPVIGVDPGPHRLPYPARLLYLFMVMPVMAFLGIALVSAGHLLYPYYAAHPPPWGATPLADQRAAGTLMWIAGMFTVVPTLAVVLLRWLDQDAREQARREAAERAVRVPSPMPADGSPPVAQR